MRLTMAQMNPVVGDIAGNVSKLLDVVAHASKDGSELVIFPELCVTGYPPQDLLERSDFISEVKSALETIREASKSFPSTGFVVGAPLPTELEEGKDLYNVAILFHDGNLLFQQAKSLLPTYDVFDEARYFAEAADIEPCEFNGERLGLTICEDAWNIPEFWLPRLYRIDPVHILVEKGATLLINISASPFSVGKEETRHKIIRHHARKHGIPFVFVNQVGGNDDLVFDGRSLFIDASGEVERALPSFEEAVVSIDTKGNEATIPYELEDEITVVFKALVLGTRDYVQKCGFEQVVLGLSGGIDSAVTCAIAAHAIGPEHVHTVIMPSPYSSQSGMNDALTVAKNLGVNCQTIPISDAMEIYDRLLSVQFKGHENDVTEENIQARIRGNLLMALSNKFNYLPLSTGNKSELAVGYCTLYGDLSGGLAVISDVPKTIVYKLAHYINRDREVIPRGIIEKPPSAELKPGQADQDVLPPYDVLDAILIFYIDEKISFEEIVKKGFDPNTVRWVIDAVRKNEYKRKQAPPGLKVTSKAFGAGRRMPVAAKYDG